MVSKRRSTFKFGLICLSALLLLAVCSIAFSEDCISFDPTKVEAKQISGNWKVVQGDMWMLDFGASKENAVKAVQIIQHYKMDSQCFVGRPNAPMQYYLVNGKAPVGPFPGEDAIPFNPKTTEAKQINGAWKVVDGDHWMLDFGKSEANANEAVSIIKKYEFNNICFVGRPNAPMMYFRKDKPKLLLPGYGRQIPGPAMKEDCIKFNPNQVEAKQISGNWKVVQGDMWMLDFGASKEQAEKAVKIIKFYMMDQQCFVGRPNPPMQYYLTNGKAPAGEFPGEDAIPFNPKTTEAKQINGAWKVVDGDHWMLDFGANKENADTAVKIIKKYEFNHICFVGRPNAPMMYFRKDKLRLIKPGNIGVLQSLPNISVTLKANPSKYHGDCPSTITFDGAITADRACEVKYTFPRSDGATGPTFTLKFDAAGTQKVMTTWQLGADYKGWQTLKVTAPVTVESKMAEFDLKCKGN